MKNRKSLNCGTLWERSHFRGVRVGHPKYQVIAVLLHDTNYYKPIINKVCELRVNTIRKKIISDVFEGKTTYYYKGIMVKRNAKKSLDKATAHNIR